MKQYIDLSNVYINELINIDFKRAIAENVLEEANKPRYIEGSENGILLIHGLTSSPYEMLNTGERLAKAGYTVYIARISGHGSGRKNISNISMDEWYNSLKYGYSILKNSCKKVILLGYSLGGLLAVNIAKYNSVDGVMLLSPPFHIKFKPTSLAKYVKKLIKFVPIYRKLPEEVERYYTDGWPVASLHELELLRIEAINNIAGLSAPIISVMCKNDSLINVKLCANVIEEASGKNFILYGKEYKHNIVDGSYPDINSIVDEHIAKMFNGSHNKLI